MRTWVGGLRAVAVMGALSGMLAGCGGGGGSSGSSSMPAPQGGPLSITASNYQAVAQVAVSSLGFLGETGGIVTAADVSARPALLRSAVAQAQRGLQHFATPGVVLTGAQTSEVLPCSGGGSLTLTLNDQGNNGSLDAGDGLTIDAASCRESGSTLQGRLALTVQTLTGVYGSSSYSAALSMTLTALVVTTGSDTQQGDGSMTVTLSVTPAGVTSLTLDVPSLTLSGREAGQSYSTQLSSLRLSISEDAVAGRSSLSFSGGMASSSFDNRTVQISTPQTLVAIGQDDFPSSGQLLVTGGNGSKLRLSALSSTQVKLELDADGDGSYETQQTKTWAELR